MSKAMTVYAKKKVAKEWQAELAQDTATIHLLDSKHQEIIVHIGRFLLKWRERLEHGLFTEWSKAEFPNWTVRSVQNYMNFAKTFGHLPPFVLEKFDLAAGYKLSTRNTPDGLKEQATSLAEQGQTITLDTAFVLSQSPAYLRDRMSSGDITAKQAKATTGSMEALKRYDNDLFLLAEKWGVQTPEAALYLQRAFVAEVKGETNAGLLQQIKDADGWLTTDNYSVSIETADKNSLDAFDKARLRQNAYEYYENHFVTVEGGATFQRHKDGRLQIWIASEVEWPNDLKKGDKVTFRIQYKKEKAD